MRIDDQTIFVPDEVITPPQPGSQSTLTPPRACDAIKMGLPIAASYPASDPKSNGNLLGDGWSIQYKVDYESHDNLSAVHVIQTICQAWNDSSSWPLFQYVWPDPQIYPKNPRPANWPETIKISGLIEDEERLEWGWLAIMLSWIVTFIGNNQYTWPNWRPETISIKRNIPGKFESTGKDLGFLTTSLDSSQIVPLGPASPQRNTVGASLPGTSTGPAASSGSPETVAAVQVER